MGGSVKNEIKDTVTHLLAYSSTGEKYQYAVTFNIPVMSEEWVHAAWAHRDEVNARADTDAMVSEWCSNLITLSVSLQDIQELHEFLCPLQITHTLMYE